MKDGPDDLPKESTNASYENDDTSGKKLRKIKEEVDKLEIRTNLVKHVAGTVLDENVPEIKAQVEELRKTVEDKKSQE